jgi:hypothetical protein
MQSGEFRPFLNHFGLLNNFDCVCSIDNIPKTLKLNHFIICNIDKKDNPGLHWFIFLRHSRSTIVCFDSLSVDDSKKQLLTENCKFRGVKKFFLMRQNFKQTILIHVVCFVSIF